MHWGERRVGIHVWDAFQVFLLGCWDFGGVYVLSYSSRYFGVGVLRVHCGSRCCIGICFRCVIYSCVNPGYYMWCSGIGHVGGSGILLQVLGSLLGRCGNIYVFMC